MADKVYKIKIPLSDGTVKELLFVSPQGEKGVDVSSAAINDDGHLIITLSNGRQIDAGIAKGKDGFTPSIQVVPDASGWQINFINDNFQIESIYLKHGYSPQVRVGRISGGHRVYITAKYTSGEIYEEHFDVMDGEDGKPPAVSIEDIDGGHRVTIGNESFDVMDGRNGDGGGSGLIHILDGAADGSVRTSGASAESASYKLGRNAFAEGSATKASGYYSHAEGSGTVASNYAAHAEGTGTIAAGEDQHVQGTFNVEDADSKYLHIVGNGTSNTDRSNAHTIDRDGNAWFKGKVFVGGTGQDDPNAKELGTGGGSEMTDLETIALLAENDLLPTITDGSGRILTDAKNTIMLRY